MSQFSFLCVILKTPRSNQHAEHFSRIAQTTINKVKQFQTGLHKWMSCLFKHTFLLLSKLINPSCNGITKKYILPTAITAKRTRRKLSQGRAPTAPKIYMHTVPGIIGFTGSYLLGFIQFYSEGVKLKVPVTFQARNPKSNSPIKFERIKHHIVS